MSLSVIDHQGAFGRRLPGPLWMRLRSWWSNRIFWPQADYLVNQERKLLYCPIAKVACSSIKRWFLALAGEAIPDDHSIHAAAKRYSLSALSPRAARRVLCDDGYFAFAFIRDPWSRLVSGYLNKFLRVNSCSTRVTQKMGRWRAAANADGQLVDITFAQFVRWLAKCDPGRFDVHWRPQHLYLRGRGFRFLGRLEKLTDDFAELQRRLGTNLPLPRCKTTRYTALTDIPGNLPDLTPRQLLELGGLPDNRHFYTDELRDCAARIYVQDIRIGGYRFE